MADQDDFRAGAMRPGRPGPAVPFAPPAWAVPPGAGPGRVPARRRRPWRVVYWVSLALLCAAAGGLLAGFVMTSSLVRVTAGGMSNTLQPGDRALYQRGAGSIARGDLVVVSIPSGGILVRRLIGLPGDRVTCCDARHLVTVNGRALNEPYVLSPGRPDPRDTVSVTLGPGQVWVLGDNRAVALDSRDWGPLSVTAVQGRIIEIVSQGTQDGRFLLVRTPATFTAAGLAPADDRLPVPVILVTLSAFALMAAAVQGISGFVPWLSRRGGRRREARARAAVSGGPR